MNRRDNNHGKFFGPVQIYTGYVFIACGLLFLSYSLATIFFLIPGTFLAFTKTGTLIDIENKKIKPYTILFGFIKTGKWIETSDFCKFKIFKSNRRYTSYSRANIKLDMNVTDISLMILNRSGKKKVLIKRFKNFGDASKEMDEYKELLFGGSEYDKSIDF